MIQRRHLVIVTGASALAAPALRAQGGFPSRPVTLICTYPAGGTTDTLTRTLAQVAAARLGQSLIVENRPGAGTSLGPAAVARARADGYTLTLFGEASIRTALLTRTGYDVPQDFTPVIRLFGFMLGLAVRADAPWADWGGFVAAARAAPGTLAFGSTGVHTAPHLVMEQLARREGISLIHVPYRGEPDSIQALLGGQIGALAAGPGAGALVDERRARWLNLWTAARHPRFPAVPTLIELGYPFSATTPIGIVGPAGMEGHVVARLHEAFRHATSDPAYQALLMRLGMHSEYQDSDAYAGYLRRKVPEERDFLRALGALSG